MKTTSENKIIINAANDSIIMNNKDDKLVISFNKTYNAVYCGNACTPEQLEEFLTFLAKKDYLSVKILMKGKPEETRSLRELKPKRKARKDKGVKRKEKTDDGKGSANSESEKRD